jgi:HSP20 family protein
MTILVSRPSRPVATSPREMEDLQDRLGQLTQAFFGDVMPLADAARRSALAMPVDIEETDDAYIVDVDLPNVREDGVQVELRGNELRIFGQFQDRRRTGILRRRSRQEGEFEFMIGLPGEVDADRVDATLEHGVLRVVAPKVSSGQARRIEVHRAQETPRPAPPGSPAPGSPQQGTAIPGAAQRTS